MMLPGVESVVACLTCGMGGARSSYWLLIAMGTIITSRLEERFCWWRRF